ncbi:MFS transporter [Roseicella aquatilis]|uniref:MFS transporter n=1 Tax=Roseicella aquatilis TaxID=2527868 RepID=A0A4R4DY00_9PROT|nr:MFS transporter [Roseicella aquatilis]TCZ66689.1 MFS transporter [Roseicella aquatilis]
MPRAPGASGYLLLFLALFLGWGVLSPFLPAVLAERGATPAEIGVILGAGIAARLVATPLAGLLADRWAAPRLLLGATLLLGACFALGYGAATGFAGLLLVGLLQSAATGPVGALPDALAVRALNRPGARLDYGAVRGAGAAAFVAGTALAGLAVGAAGGAGVVLWLHAACFLLAAAVLPGLAAPAHVAGASGRRRALPEAVNRPPGHEARPEAGAARRLLALPQIRALLLVTALIQGSHALQTGYATLRWEAAGLSPEIIGLLWGLSVAAEVLVFLLLGRRLLARLGPAGLCALAAGAGVLRWSVMATTAALPAMLLVQPLHGLTFAAQHLAAMAVLARVAPPGLAATAQSLYATLGGGLSTALLTVVSGLLYGRYGAAAFWAMAVLCLAALPPARRLQASLAG